VNTVLLAALLDPRGWSPIGLELLTGWTVVNGEPCAITSRV